jgi:intracellular sulfur oxidation DsrE/DsrF family protein
MSLVRLAALVATAMVAASACVHVKTTNDSAAMARAPASENDYQFQRVVYQNSGGLPDDRAYFLRVLRNIGAHVAATDGNVEIRLVSFSGGVKVFQQAKSDQELAKAIDAVLEKKVRLLVCRNTMRAMSLTVADVYGVTEADIVPSGVAELARLQGQGFVYIHP